MSWENIGPNGVIGHFTASSDYSAATDQYTLVTVTTGLLAQQQTTRGAWCAGVLLNTPSSGQMAEIGGGAGSVYKVQVGSTHAAIVPGSQLHCSTAFQALPGTSESYVTLGRSLENLAADTSGIIAMQWGLEGSGSSST